MNWIVCFRVGGSRGLFRLYGVESVVSGVDKVVCGGFIAWDYVGYILIYR